MPTLRIIVSAVILCATIAVGAFFALQNTTQVPLDLLVVQLAERSLALWLLLTLLLGVLLGVIASAVVALRQRGQLVVLRRKNQRLGVEIERLRKVGFTESE